jgi:hypothetical protein
VCPISSRRGGIHALHGGVAGGAVVLQEGVRDGESAGLGLCCWLMGLPWLRHSVSRRPHSRTVRSRSEFPTTERELRVIAALAQIGLIRMPKNGYSSPAATGTLKAL